MINFTVKFDSFFRHSDRVLKKIKQKQKINIFLSPNEVTRAFLQHTKKA
jgi:hypothetical protein